MKNYYVYILASRKHGTLCIGVTGDLGRRIWQHRSSDAVDGFTNRYKVHRLVYMEEFQAPELAIAREKSLKKWPREWKINLIEGQNPDWADLYGGLNR
jgi:putative endonuclease